MSIELDIFGDIGASLFGGGVTPSHVRTALRAGPKRPVTVRVNSRGGDVLDGLAIHGLLARHEAPVTVEILGVAASIASVIAMAGNEIKIADTAMLMVHNPWAVARGEAEDFRAMADLLEKMQTTLAGVYALRTGRTSTDVRAWMDKETYFTASEAVAHGFATTITKGAQVRAERQSMQQTLIPAAVAKAGLTARFTELARQILAATDPDQVERLLAERDALIRQAEGAAPQAAAQGTEKAWHELAPMQQARILNTDPARARSLKAAHQSEIESATAALRGATDYPTYSQAWNRLRLLNGVTA